MNERDRLKLRADVSFVAVDGGVLLRNQHGSYTVRGKGAYELVRRLFGMLDGHQTGPEICAQLPTPLQAAVERQLAVLRERGFVRAARSPQEPPPEWAEALYGEQLDFLEEEVDDAWQAFQWFRATRLFCTGSGELLRSLLVQLAAYGAADIRVAADGDGVATNALLAELTARDPLARFARVDEADGAPKDYDMLLMASDHFEPDLARRLFETATSAGLLSAIAMPVGPTIVGAPLLGQNSCWECVYRSLTLDAGDGGAAISPVAAGLASNHLAHAIFLHYTEAAAETATIAVIDAERLTARVHAPPARHPRCGRHGPIQGAPPQAELDRPIRPDISRSTDPVAVTEWQNAISDRIVALVDEDLGPLIAVGEERLPQAPLSASRCIARSSSSTPREPGRFATVCRGLSTREARNQAVLFVVERLAREVLDEEDVAIGAGWSAAEAQYRALVHGSLKWARARPTFQDEATIVEAIADDNTAYFRACLDESRGASYPAACMPAPTGLIVAHVSAGKGSFAFGAGPGPDAAVANATAALACAVDPGGEGGDEVAPAILTLQEGSWAALLDSVVRRSASPPAFRDASALLPAFADKVHVALWRDMAN